MKETFIEKGFSQKTLDMIAVLNGILQSYEAQGYKLSLRQLYYQLVSKALVENTERSYKRIGEIVSNARLAGLLDWHMIEDRGRETVSPPMWNDPAQIVDAAASQFAIDRWADQPNHVEVMVEKAALEGVLIPVCQELGIRFTANKGYGSQSLLYEIGNRYQKIRGKRKNVYMLYLGDHDPSGIDMSRDVRDRLELFSRNEVTVLRLALNMSQVEEWNPPENPAKTTDSRYQNYIIKYGESSWELDAIEPATLATLVYQAVTRLRDDTLYEAAVARETAMRNELKAFVRQYRKNTGKH